MVIANSDVADPALNTGGSGTRGEGLPAGPASLAQPKDREPPGDRPKAAPADAPGRRVNMSQLVNRLNFTHFQEDPILLHFAHRVYGNTVVLPVLPQPCLGETLDCVWAETPALDELRRAFSLTCALVPRRKAYIRFEPQVIEMSSSGLRLALTDTAREAGHRRAERHGCREIGVHVIQNSGLFSGILLDFSASSFRVALKVEPPQSFDWIDPTQPVHAVFFCGSRTFFTGECLIIRSNPDGAGRCYVLEPVRNEIQRFRKAEFRSRRQRLNPSPNMIFRHPLTGKRVELKIVDVSGAGFSVEEEGTGAVLLTGLILPEIELHFAGSPILACSAQVVFRRPIDAEDPEGRIRCGLALIDVAPQDHVRLLAMLHQVTDDRSYVCNAIDLAELWDFFFETGFIYPKKYGAIFPRKEQIKSTYEKLYTRCPDIARHFVYQENGVILGHLAMIRLWEESWLIHHHAARVSGHNKAGLVVLDQTGRFGYDAHRICSMHMKHVLTFYRPENKFPSRIFGGVARYINNPKGCWVDSFAFVTPAEGGADGAALPGGWVLAPATSGDFVELNHWYEGASGGRMLHALDLEAENWQRDTLAAEFARHGFRREKRLFALKSQGDLKAVLAATATDIGLNLSELTRCTYVFVVDPRGLTAGILKAALESAQLAAGQPDAPALVTPLAYAQSAAVPHEKIYNLWGLQISGYSDAYFRYLDRIMRRV